MQNQKEKQRIGLDEQHNEDKQFNWLLVLLGVMLVTIVVLGIIVYLGYKYNLDWVGVGEDTQSRYTTEFQRSKTLWDWLGLLIAPLVLAGAAALFNWAIIQGEKRTRNELRAVNAQIKAQSELAAEARDYATLEKYIDKMTELIFQHGLAMSKEQEGTWIIASNIARTRTLAVLRSLRVDVELVNEVFQFIKEANLNEVVSLAGGNLTHVKWEGADIREANLRGANLRRANLRNANLRRVLLQGATLRNADLSGADLSEADLRDARLSGADLSGAKLNGALVTSEQLAEAKTLEGAILPDGKKHLMTPRN